MDFNHNDQSHQNQQQKQSKQQKLEYPFICGNSNNNKIINYPKQISTRLFSSTHNSLQTLSDINYLSSSQQFFEFNNDARQSMGFQQLDQQNIEVIDYSKQLLDRLPKNFYQIYLYDSVRILNLSDNKFTLFFPEICEMRQLKCLKLDFNYISKLPAEFAQLQKLQILSISNNALYQLPNTFSNLMELRVLNLGKNNLEPFPIQLCSLPMLESLHIFNNYFTSLPVEIKQLKKLKEFTLEWFKYCLPPLEPLQSSQEVLNKIFNMAKLMDGENERQISFKQFIELFTQDIENLFKKDTRGRTILHQAAVNEEVGVIKSTLTNQDNLNSQIDEEDCDKQTALTLALIEEKYISCRVLLFMGANPAKGGGKLGSPLHIALTKMETEIIVELLMKGANPSITDDEGNTPLHLLFCIFSRCPKKAQKIAEILIEYGADPNSKNIEKWNPLHLAVRRSQKEALMWTLEYNIIAKQSIEKSNALSFDFNAEGGQYGWTPLHLACSIGNIEIIQILTSQGGDGINLFAYTQQNQSTRKLAAANQIICKILKKSEENYIKARVIKRESCFQSATTQNKMLTTLAQQQQNAIEYINIENFSGTQQFEGSRVNGNDNNNNNNNSNNCQQHGKKEDLYCSEIDSIDEFSDKDWLCKNNDKKTVLSSFSFLSCKSPSYKNQLLINSQIIDRFQNIIKNYVLLILSNNTILADKIQYLNEIQIISQKYNVNKVNEQVQPISLIMSQKDFSLSRQSADMLYQQNEISEIVLQSLVYIFLNINNKGNNQELNKEDWVVINIEISKLFHKFNFSKAEMYLKDVIKSNQKNIHLLYESFFSLIGISHKKEQSIKVLDNIQNRQHLYQIQQPQQQQQIKRVKLIFDKQPQHSQIEDSFGENINDFQTMLDEKNKNTAIQFQSLTCQLNNNINQEEFGKKQRHGKQASTTTANVIKSVLQKY